MPSGSEVRENAKDLTILSGRLRIFVFEVGF
jgi:hypothetical protein